MEIDEEKTYIIKDIHPRDAFHEFRKELIGQAVKLTNFSPDRFEEGDFIGCRAMFVSPVVAENIYLSEAIFFAIRIEEKDVEHNRGKIETQTNEDHQDQEAPKNFREETPREKARRIVQRNRS